VSQWFFYKGFVALFTPRNGNFCFSSVIFWLILLVFEKILPNLQHHKNARAKKTLL
jgi:hypothetical protein